MHDAIAAVELALAEAAEVTGRPLRDLAQVDADGNVVSVVTIVTDNGGPFRAFRFEAFIATHPELRHVRTRVRTPGQNGSRERGFGSLKYERLFLEEIPDAIDLAAHAEGYRIECNTVRPHEAIAWNRPIEVHLGHADPKIPNFPEPQTHRPGPSSTTTRQRRSSPRRSPPQTAHRCDADWKPPR